MKKMKKKHILWVLGLGVAGFAAYMFLKPKTDATQITVKNAGEIAKSTVTNAAQSVASSLHF